MNIFNRIARLFGKKKPSIREIKGADGKAKAAVLAEKGGKLTQAGRQARFKEWQRGMK
jgi:hypothetical protein